MKSKNQILSLMQILKTALHTHLGDNVKDVILFGSQATGTAIKNSDFDILIILKNNYDWKYRKQIIEIIYEIELEYDVLFDVHLISLYELKKTLKGTEPIYRNAINNGIHIE